MASNFPSLLRRLEAKQRRRAANLSFRAAWGEDAETAKQRLREERGPIGEDEFLVVSWLAPQG